MTKDVFAVLFYFRTGKRKITGNRHEETCDSVYNGMTQRLTLPYLPSGSTVKREVWMELRERQIWMLSLWSDMETVIEEK